MTDHAELREFHNAWHSADSREHLSRMTGRTIRAILRLASEAKHAGFFLKPLWLRNRVCAPTQCERCKGPIGEPVKGKVLVRCLPCRVVLRGNRKGEAGIVRCGLDRSQAALRRCKACGVLEWVDRMGAHYLEVHAGVEHSREWEQPQEYQSALAGWFE